VFKEDAVTQEQCKEYAMLIQAQIIGLKALLSMGFSEEDVNKAADKMVKKVLFHND